MNAASALTIPRIRTSLYSVESDYRDQIGRNVYQWSQVERHEGGVARHKGDETAKGEQIVRAPVGLVKATRRLDQYAFPSRFRRVRAIRSRTAAHAVQYIFGAAGIPI
jgi:hypothetical protein